VTLNATQGQQFHIEWTTTAQFPTSLDFYIATPSAYTATWYCDTGPTALYSSSGVKGSVDWTAPFAGQFTVILVNYNANPVSVAWLITTPTITTVTTISYATATTTSLVTTLQIVAASSYSNSSWIIGAIGIVVLLIVLVFLTSRRGTKVDEKREKKAEDISLCRICGAKLVPDARFCKKCGTAVSGT